MSDNIDQMNIKQLRNEVQLLRDELAIMRRKFEDIIYNLDTDNFSSRFVKEQGDMRTAIEVTAEGIKTKVSNEEFESTKKQLASQITSEVKKLDDTLSSEISQTASDIRSVVSKNISVKFESDVKPTYSNTTDAKKGMLCEYDGNLYYYNDITKTWEEYPYADGIRSQFVQTSSGFELTGDVSIKSHDKNGNEVQISDGNIQFFPDGYNVSLVDLSMYKIGEYWQPRWRFGRGSDFAYDGSGTGWIYKTTTGFGMLYNTKSGKTLSIEFNDGNDAINIIGDVVFSGGEVSGLDIGSGTAVFGE